MKTIISIGEVVWDIFPDGNKVLGGAPINVAYHLHSLGLDVKIITRIGKDLLGEETLDALSAIGLPLEGIQKGDLPTGVVNITIKNNEPSFDIVAPAAWDNIDKDKAVRSIGQRSFDMVFGTLAQRDARTATTIRELWKQADRRFYDVNLRPPFTTKALVAESLKAADLAKMNGDELVEIGNWFGCDGIKKEDIARCLVEEFDIPILAVTEGAAGAWLIAEGRLFKSAGVEVEVADTVGAGDAFFATLIKGYVTKRSWPETLEKANRRGAYVASQKGATPPMDK